MRKTKFGEAKGKAKLVLYYEWAGSPICIGETRDPDLLVRVADSILHDAEDKVEMLRPVDPVVAIEAECELITKRRMLAAVMPIRLLEVK